MQTGMANDYTTFSANRHIEHRVVKNRYLLLPLDAHLLSEYNSYCVLRAFLSLKSGKVIQRKL